MDIKIIGKTYDHVTVAEAKTQARIPQNYLTDDALIGSLLMVATDQAAQYIENHVALTDIQARKKAFSGFLIDIDQGHFNSLQSIVYTDRVTGQEVTLLNDTGYEVRVEQYVFLIILDSEIDALNLKVNFKCGFDAATIQPVIKQAVLIKFVDLYDIERSSYTSGTIQNNRSFEYLLNYNKKLSFF